VAEIEFVPPGFLKLQDAVDLAGKHCYGAAWTGRETRQLSDPPPKKPSDRLEAAVDQLRGYLALGRVAALAIAENGKHFSVPVSLWLSEDGRNVFNTGFCPPVALRESLQRRQDGTLRRRILVQEKQLRALLIEEAGTSGAAAHQTTIAAETRCRDWLAQQMKEYERRPHNKTWYKAQAQEKFDVGSKAFDRAWANAIAASGNTNWSKPGRRPNS
jgi:hypothetical protein